MIIPKKKSIWPICRLGSGYQFDHCDCHAHWSYDTTDATETKKWKLFLVKNYLLQNIHSINRALNSIE